MGGGQPAGYGTPRYGRPMMGGPFGGFSPFRRPVMMGGPMMGGPVMRGPGYGGPVRRMPYGSGGGCGCAGLIGLVVLLVIIFFIAAPLSMCSAPYYAAYSSESPVEVPANTVEREPLPLSAAQETQFYVDADGDWISNPSVLEQGMREFWQETGVYPFLYIAPNGSLTSGSQCHEVAASIYDRLFTDSAHMVLVFCDDGQGGFTYGYEIGSQARTVMDDAAVQTLVAYLERYYDTAPTEDEMFADAFTSTAQNIMNVQEPAYVTAMPVIIVAIVAGVIVFVVYTVRKRNAERDAHVREILEEPLEKYGDEELEDLEEKYKDDV